MTHLQTALRERIVRLRSFEAEHQPWVGLIVKESHDLIGRPRLLSPRPLAFVEARVLQGLRLVEETDWVAPVKPLTDVTLAGSVHSPVDAPFVVTSLSAGELSRSVTIWGERRLSIRSGHVELGDAAPFRSAELGRQHAFGGPGKRRRGAFGQNRAGLAATPPVYARNPSGRGFVATEDLETLHGALAPAQEDPTDPIESADFLLGPSRWIEAPLPADYGPIDLAEFPRAAYAVPQLFPERGLESARGWQIEAPEVRADLAAQSGPPGLFGALRGGLEVRAENLFPDGGEAWFRLPKGPSAGILEFEGAGREHLELTLKGVHLRPDEARLELVWAGRIRVAVRFSEEALGRVVGSVAA